ncbi:MAG TPA: hypothetical protein VEA99_14135 [Gemmatimonadaceae bacterium]|nr:hypothetical protein [Gemmatimonadaceae bacterium]
MREYRYLATESTVEAMRLLRGAWVAYRVEQGAFTVRLADDLEVRIDVDGADVEPEFEAFRLAAVSGSAAMLPPVRGSGAFRPAPDFAVGRNDIVLFTGATWIEGPGDGAGEGAGAARLAAAVGEREGTTGQTVQFSGHPAQISESASAVCLTTDAMVIASPIGTGFLVRTGVRPYAVQVSDDAGEIARFLAERGYRE